MVTDEERREVARKLRELADGHAAVECSAVAKALALDYEAHGSIAAFSSDAVAHVADLIEPSDETWLNGYDVGFASADDWYAQHTDEELAEHGLMRERTCHMLPMQGGGYGCDSCYTWFGEMKEEPRYCPNCRARVVRG